MFDINNKMAYRKKYLKKRKIVRRRSASKKGSGLRRVIRKVLSREAETKDRTYGETNQDIMNPSAGILFDNTGFPCSPYQAFLQIDQGTGEGARVANKVTTKRVTLKGSFQTSPYNAISNPVPQPIVVKMWFYYDKMNRTVTTAPRASNDFFNFNNGTRPMAGNLSDLWTQVNTDRYTVLKSYECKLGYASNNGTGTIPATQGYANNDFKSFQRFSFDLTKHVPKNVVFVDNNSNPTSRILMCMVETIYANGSSMASTTVPAFMSYELVYEYKDI